MSLYAVPSYSVNKGSSLFEHSTEDLGANFFDQFLTLDPIDNDGSDYPVLPDSTLSPNFTQENNIRATASGSLIEEPSYNHILASSSDSYTELSGRPAISDSDLLSLENISLGSPLSLAHSPTIRANSLPSKTSSPNRPTATIARRRARIVEPLSKVFKKAPASEQSLRSPIRKAGKSPSMVRCSESFQNNLGLMGNILNSGSQIDLKHPVGLSTPPQTARLSDASEASSSAGLMKEGIDDIFGFSNGFPQRPNGRPADYETPSATPILDGHHSRKTSVQQPFSDGIGFPPTPQFHHSSGAWSQLSGSSELNSYGFSATHSPEIGTPVWWNHAATAPMAQPSPTALHANPRQASESLAYHLQHDLSYEPNGLNTSKAASGLMISMAEVPALQSFIVNSPHEQSPHIVHHGYFDHSHTHATHHQYPSYVPGAALHQQHTSSMCKTHSSTRNQSESPSPKSASSNFQIRKRRTTRGSKEKKTPGLGSADFVNFTPSDSRKILTGVAPSGSSKTRARREKEAMDKRRKLSLAALRAVRAAGGDVESLVEQGLFV